MGHVAQAFPETDPEWRRELTLRSYEHLAMLAVEVSAMPRLITPDAWAEHVEVAQMDAALRELLSVRPTLLITGHVGNWEVVGATLGVLGFPIHALYRPLDMKPLDRWLRRTRGAQGIELLDKFGAAIQLPRLLASNERVAFVADQNAGDRGLSVPYFGRLTSTYKTIGVLAMRYGASIVCGHARRLGWDDGGSSRGRRVGGSALRYRIEIIDTFGPDEYMAQPDPQFYIAARYRRAFEGMIRAAPEQYLWMHRIWKSRPPHERANKPMPDRLRAKIADLPWTTDADVEAIEDRSDRDRALLAELGVDRLP